jgi:hypothetical protein
VARVLDDLKLWLPRHGSLQKRVTSVSWRGDVHEIGKCRARIGSSSPSRRPCMCLDYNGEACSAHYGFLCHSNVLGRECTADDGSRTGSDCPDINIGVRLWFIRISLLHLTLLDLGVRHFSDVCFITVEVTRHLLKRSVSRLNHVPPEVPHLEEQEAAVEYV